MSELSTECDFYQLQELKIIVKSKEEQPEVVKRKNIDELLRLNSQRDYYNETTQNLVLRNLIFNNLIFSKILFRHSVDFSGSSFINVLFDKCEFNSSCQYSFDGSDLKDRSFRSCWVESENPYRGISFQYLVESLNNYISWCEKHWFGKILHGRNKKQYKRNLQFIVELAD